jgi:WD40 repeat protein
VFCPARSEVKEQFWKERLPFIKKVTGSIEDWDPCLQTLNGHNSNVSAVAFSPNGKRLVSASAGDGLVRFWDAAMGSALQRLEDETGGL